MLMWEQERERVAQGIAQVLEVELAQFCDPPTPQMLDDFSKYVMANCVIVHVVLLE